MALVRISKQLIQDVEQRIGHLRNAEVNEFPKPSFEVKSTPGDGAEPLATQILWGEHLHLKSQMPSDWVKKVERPQFNTLYVHDDGSTERTAAVQFTDAGVSIPPGKNVGWNGTIEVQVPYFIIEEAFIDDTHRFHAVATRVMHVVNFEKHSRKVRKAWESRQQQIIMFLNKCKSLNEAIKLWPEIKLYVPTSYIDTVETPVVRPQNVVRKEKALENVDTDGLTAAAIAARLAGVL